MKYPITFLLLLFASLSLQAQEAVTWKGGTPGRETDWFEARNWSDYTIPDAETHVHIRALHTGHHAMPVITEEVEVASISIFGGAELHIESSGSLIIDGREQYTEGILNFGGKLMNQGLISMMAIEGDFNPESFAWMAGEGIILLDEMKLMALSQENAQP